MEHAQCYCGFYMHVHSPRLIDEVPQPMLIDSLFTLPENCVSAIEVLNTCRSSPAHLYELRVRDR